MTNIRLPRAGDTVDCYQRVGPQHPFRTRIVRILGAHSCTVQVGDREKRVNLGACRPVPKKEK